MKIKYFLGALLAMMLLGFSPLSQAYCRWVGAHWHHGYYVPAHLVCCKRVGYWDRWGRWHRGKRVCWIAR